MQQSAWLAGVFLWGLALAQDNGGSDGDSNADLAADNEEYDNTKWTAIAYGAIGLWVLLVIVIVIMYWRSKRHGKSAGAGHESTFVVPASVEDPFEGWDAERSPRANRR